MSKSQSLGASLLLAIVLSLVCTASSEPIAVEPWEDLQSIVDSAPAGSVVTLREGAVYEGPLILRRDITIRSAGFTGESVNSEVPLRGLVSRVYTGSAVVAGQIRVQGCNATLEGIVVEPGLRTGIVCEAAVLEMIGCRVELGANGLHLQAGTQARLIDCSVVWSSLLGIVVETSSSLVLDSTSIVGAQLGGLSVAGTASIESSNISFCGYSPSSEPHVFIRTDLESTAGEATAFGIELWSSAAVQMNSTWIAENRGPGLFLPDYSESGEPPDLSGSGNMISESLAPFPNVLGTSNPRAYEMEENWAFAVWTDGFLVDSLTTYESFSWSYLEIPFSFDAMLEIPVRRFIPEKADYSRCDRCNPLVLAANDVSTLSSIRPVVDTIVELGEAQGFGKIALVEMIVAFIRQSVCYDSQRADGVLRSANGYLLPVVTLAMGAGVCRDSSVLASSMLELAGFDTVLIGLDRKVQTDSNGHMVIGVAVDGAWGAHIEHNGKDYYLIEPTSRTCPNHGFDAPRLGEFELDYWHVTEIAQLQFEADLDVDLAFQDAADMASTGILGTISVRNGGTISSFDGSITVCASPEYIFDCASRASIAFELPPLAPGESVSFPVPVSLASPIHSETKFHAEIQYGENRTSHLFIYW